VLILARRRHASSTATEWPSMLAIALLVPLAWLLGAFPTAVLVARAKGRDVLREGSGNPGASNVGRVLGWRWGALVLAADVAKGALAAGVGLEVGGRPGAYVLGFAAVLGHTFPLYRKGGKGVAAAGGTLLVLYPLITLGLAAVWLIVARALHKASLASLLVAIAFPVAVVVTGHDVWEDVVIVALSLLIIGRHSGNIKRLVRRQEFDLGAGRP
jgi:acyl phosphate:glycerol-3-phosphate acyltransferase